MIDVDFAMVAHVGLGGNIGSAAARDYHAAIGEIIIKYNGTLERYADDGVMVVFNDPVPVENPALQAVLMACVTLSEP
jgi:class 3 adenylate cyclase